jgi:hypothetical protein
VKLPGVSGPIGFSSTRFCRVKLGGDISPLGSPSTRLCTDQFIRALLPDKIFALLWECASVLASLLFSNMRNMGTSR